MIHSSIAATLHNSRLLHSIMEQSTQVNGSEEKGKEEVTKSGKMVLATSENGLMIKQMDLVNYSTLMVTYMRESG